MKLKPAYQFLLLCLVTLGVYYPTLSAPLNSLDDQVIVNQLLNQQDFSLSRHFAPGGVFPYFRPLLTLTFEVDKYVGGLQEPFMHLVNILIHVLNVGLVWLFAKRFGRLLNRPSEWLPFIAALFFALHPIQTEAVNWIMGRTDLLAGTFVFTALICLLHFVEERSLPWGVAGALSFLLGALCKETALFLFPAVCFLLMCRSVAWSTWALRWLLPGFYGLATVGYLALRRNALHGDLGMSHAARVLGNASGMGEVSAPAAEATVESFQWLEAVRVALKAAGFYLVKLVQPLPLNFAINKVGEFYLLPGLCLVIVLGVLVWRRRPLGWLFLTSTAIAMSALAVLFTGLAWTPIAERYMYIPCGPFAVGVVYASDRFVRPRFHPCLVSLGVVPLLAVAAWATFTRNLIWQDNLTLYQNAVLQSPDFAPARTQLALALNEHGRSEEGRELLLKSGIEAQNQTAVNRAAALLEKGDYPAARADLLQRLQAAESQHLQIQILETLIGMTSRQASKTRDEALKRGYYKDMLHYLEQIHARLPNGFLLYRIGRIHLLLNNRAEAQKAFAGAAEHLPADSIYKEPATKLARDLAQ